MRTNLPGVEPKPPEVALLPNMPPPVLGDAPKPPVLEPKPVWVMVSDWCVTPGRGRDVNVPDGVVLLLAPKPPNPPEDCWLVFEPKPPPNPPPNDMMGVRVSRYSEGVSSCWKLSADDALLW